MNTAPYETRTRALIADLKEQAFDMLDRHGVTEDSVAATYYISSLNCVGAVDVYLLVEALDARAQASEARAAEMERQRDKLAIELVVCAPRCPNDSAVMCKPRGEAVSEDEGNKLCLACWLKFATQKDGEK